MNLITLYKGSRIFFSMSELGFYYVILSDLIVGLPPKSYKFDKYCVEEFL